MRTENTHPKTRQDRSLNAWNTVAGITRGPRPTDSLQRGQGLVSKMARIGFQGEREGITRVDSEVVARYPDQGFLEKQPTRMTFPLGSRSYRQIELSPVERFHQGNARIDHHFELHPGISPCELGQK